MIIFDQEILDLAARVITNAKAQNLTLGCVESCTGGLASAALTTTKGSSDAFAGGLITYSNQIKKRLVGVQQETLDQHGAVSSQVAAHMAMGGMSVLGVHRCVSITGIAGPDGGTENKPVGTIWFALAIGGKEEVKCSLANFKGDRNAIRIQSVLTALTLLDPGNGSDS